jgi:hypothetical protein
VYTWQPPSQDVPVPWVELRFPHIERRLVLDGAGRWAQAPL